MATPLDSATTPIKKQKTSEDSIDEEFKKKLESLSVEISQESSNITSGVELIQVLEKYDLHISSCNIHSIEECLLQIGRADLASTLLSLQHTTASSALLTKAKFPPTGNSQKEDHGSTYITSAQSPMGISQRGGQGSTNIGILNADIYVPDMQASGPVFMARDHMVVNISNYHQQPSVDSTRPSDSTDNSYKSNRDSLSEISQILSKLKILYGSHYSRVKPFPWLSRECVANLKEHFCTLHLVTRGARKELRQSKVDAPIPELLSKLRKCTPLKLCDIFTPNKDGKPRRILIEGEPGIGKTSLCVKLATDWSQGEAYIAEEFKGVFFIRARNAKTSIKETLCTALRMNHSEVEQLWNSLLESKYQNLFLFIIDGLDEVHSLPIEYIDLIEGRLLFHSCVLVTSRTNQWQSKLSSTTDSLDSDFQLFDREIINVGFTKDTAFEFINTVGSVKREESQIQTLQQFILQHEFLEDLIRSPLICIFLCTMWNENYIIVVEEKEEFRRTVLYANMVECLVKRFCQHTKESDYKLINGKLSTTTLEKLGQVYEVAYCALQEGKVQISLGDIKSYLKKVTLDEDDVMFSFGILVKETEFLDFNEEIVFAFPHRTVQEELSSEYYVTMSDKSVNATKNIIDNFPLMCIFSSGLIYHRKLDQTLLVTLFSEMANTFQTNINMNDDNNILNIALECVFECSYQTLLTNIIAERLPISFDLKSPSTSVVSGLFECLNNSKTCVDSVSSENVFSVIAKLPPVINILGLASVFKNNRVLRKLSLSGVLKYIANKGDNLKINDKSCYQLEWETLKDAVKSNTTLTQLNLPDCEISDRGWEALGEGLKTNTALKLLDLSICKIPERGWKALGEALKANRTLKELDLSFCDLPDGGWEALRVSLKSNTALTKLFLISCKITDRGCAALGEALKTNRALIMLNLRDCVEISDKGWADLAEGLKNNTTLKTLHLNGCKILDGGCEVLGEALKENTALTQLDLRWCKISDRGREALGKGIKANKTLTQTEAELLSNN